MEIVRDPLPSLRMTTAGGAVRLAVDRQTLAKRRWRGVADDGREFGFDLTEPLHDGSVFFVDKESSYAIAQKPEPILELRVEAGSPIADQMRVAWMIGNLHFPIEIGTDRIRVADDPALRQLFQREYLPYEARENVFHPLSGHHHH
jgi:urease accessory protein